LVILKQGRIKIAHFAHKPPTDCAWAVGETLAHLKAKQWMADGLRARGYSNVALEVVIGGDPYRRADVVVTDSKNKRLALELQHTSISLDEIEARAAHYACNGIAQLWVPFLRARAFDEAERLRDEWHICRYPARPFERWVHGFGLGSIWLYDPSRLALYRGRMKGHVIEVEDSEWYGEGGELQSGGGYSYWSRRWRELTLAGPYQVTDLSISIRRRPMTNMHRYSWPAAEIGDFSQLAASQRLIATH
jgi:competence protein CoiA